MLCSSHVSSVSGSTSPLPGVSQPTGRRHPLTTVQHEIESIFMRMGFDVATGPEIETEYYNFEALNIPAEHPARADWDTFFIDEDRLLRPHTQPGADPRYGEDQAAGADHLPRTVLSPRDTQDATHSPVFHQIELLWVEKGLTLANLKHVLEVFHPGVFRRRIRHALLWRLLPVYRAVGAGFTFGRPVPRVGWRSWGPEWSIPPS